MLKPHAIYVKSGRVMIRKNAISLIKKNMFICDFCWHLGDTSHHFLYFIKKNHILNKNKARNFKMRSYKSVSLAIALAMTMGCTSTQPQSVVTKKPIAQQIKHTDEDALKLFNELKLANVLSEQAFVNGYKMAMNSKFSNRILVVLDFTKHSAKKRLFVFDLDKREFLYSTFVSHGMNSGGSYANEFSNEPNSNKTSLGYMVTNETYYGKNGFSLRLDGMIKGLNDNLRKRHIVIHSSKYANPEFIEINHRLGRSNGCFAIPEKIAPELINKIKGGAIVYSYHDGVRR